jgi:hypothetical protein
VLLTQPRALPDSYSVEEEESDVTEGYTEGPSIPVVHEADLLKVYAMFGVGDMMGVEGTEARVVQLSPRSELACPLHGLTAFPDACRSCRFLCGEAS